MRTVLVGNLCTVKSFPEEKGYYVVEVVNGKVVGYLPDADLSDFVHPYHRTLINGKVRAYFDGKNWCYFAEPAPIQIARKIFELAFKLLRALWNRIQKILQNINKEK